MSKILLPLLVTFAVCDIARAVDLADYDIVDLTHAYTEATIYWPTSPSRFELTTLAEGPTGDGWYYSAYSICTPEHGGAHLDAPMHFAENGAATDDIPLVNLIASAVVVDITEKAARDREYRLGVDTASIDFGPATDFPVHRIAAAANIPGLENLTNLEALPPAGGSVSTQTGASSASTAAGAA